MAQDVADDVCDSWEDMIENGVLEKKLEELQLKSPRINSASEDQSDHPLAYPPMKLEDNSRTPYTPQVKILKRPPNDRAVVVADKSPSRQPPKTLQQREAEYAQARLRILGSAHSSQEEQQSASSPNSLPLVASEKRSQAEVIVTRLPRGPDGTDGFTQQR